MGARGALALSVAAHAAVGAAWSSQAAVRVMTPPPAELIPMSVTFTVAPAPPREPVAPVEPAAPAAPTVPGPSAPKRAPAPSRAPRAQATASAPLSLAMRPRVVDLSLPAAAVEGAQRGDGHVEPPPATSGRLEPTEDGGAVIRDRVAKVIVAPDGTARFRDAPNIDPHLILPSARRFGTLLDEWYKDPDKKVRFGRQAASPYTQGQGPPERRSDATLPANPPASKVGAQTLSSLLLPYVVGTMDVTDWLMRRAHIGDPYSARKLALLDRTRDERIQRGRAYREAQMSRAAELMARNLTALWRRSLAPDERRAAVFELWDECGEGEGRLGEAGEAARRVVRRWIGLHLAAGTADEFTAAELAAFNARRLSSQAFEPYAALPGP